MKRGERAIGIITLDDPPITAPPKGRIPPPQFVGKVRELGDVMSSVPLSDWGIT